MIVPIVPVASNNVQTTETTIWEHCQDDLKRPRRLRRPRSLEWNWVLSRRSGRSSKFWSDHMKTLSAVDWDCGSERYKAFPKISSLIPVIGKKIRLDVAEVEKKSETKMFPPSVGSIWKKKSVPSSSRRDVTMSSWNSSSSSTPKNRKKTRTARKTRVPRSPVSFSKKPFPVPV